MQTAFYDLMRSDVAADVEVAVVVVAAADVVVDADADVEHMLRFFLQRSCSIAKKLNGVLF